MGGGRCLRLSLLHPKVMLESEPSILGELSPASHRPSTSALPSPIVGEPAGSMSSAPADLRLSAVLCAELSSFVLPLFSLVSRVDGANIRCLY